MKKLVLLAALLSFSGMVNAFGNGGDGGNANQRQGQGQGQGQAQGQLQGQLQGQAQGQANFNHSSTRTSTSTHQGQAQGNIGLGSGNETTINQSYSEDYSEMYDDYTPPAYAPSMGVSAPCKVGISGGGGIPGISITAGGYITDEDCVEAETIRMGLQSGDKGNATMANQLLEMRLQAAMAERKVENEDDRVTAILSDDADEPILASVPEPISSGAWTH